MRALLRKGPTFPLLAQFAALLRLIPFRTRRTKDHPIETEPVAISAGYLVFSGTG